MMMPLQIRATILLLLAMLLQPVAQASVTVKAGIYQNAPKIFLDQQGQPAGFFADLLNDIARQENWQLHYVPCVWHQCLDMLSAGELDIMVDVAHTPERDSRFDFGHEVVLSSWSVVYKRTGERLDSILGLHDKRVAVVTNSVQHWAIRERADRFDVKPRFVEVDSFDEAFQLLAEHQVDFVLVNRFYGELNAARFGAEGSHVLIRPSSLKFAFPKGDPKGLGSVTDAHIRAYKQEPQSVFYRSQQRWLEPLDEWQPPDWAKGLLIGGVLLLIVLVVMVAILRRLVSARTRQLEKEKAHYFHLSMHDPLTELPNRRYFSEEIKEAINMAYGHDGIFCVFYLDLDQFKHINNSAGPSVGDYLLRSVSGRLRSVVGEQGFLARFGGDEFCVLSTACQNTHDAADLAMSMIDALEPPFTSMSQSYYLSTCVGISVFPRDGKDAEQLIKHAETALYEAKNSGRKAFRFYESDMSAQAVERVSMETALRRALEKGEFVVHYQPQADLNSGEIVGLEGLIRWENPDRGLVPPGEFIPLAEETGVIVALGEWVLDSVCRQIVDWRSQGISLQKVAVNVSPHQMVDELFYRQVTQVLKDTGCDPRYLALEITESATLNYSQENLDVLRRFMALGIGIAIDDFGTGHSSLSRLKHLPVSTLKIDMAFVRGLPHDRSDVSLTRAAIALGTGMGLTVVAEGVERDEQRDFLRQAGCHIGQGYLYSRPVPASEITAMIRAKTIADGKTGIGNGNIS